MAISPKNEEKLKELETELRERGDRLSAKAIAAFGPTLRSKRLEDELRAAIYVAALHERDRSSGWDELISIDELMAVLREGPS